MLQCNLYNVCSRKAVCIDTHSHYVNSAREKESLNVDNAMRRLNEQQLENCDIMFSGSAYVTDTFISIILVVNTT